MKRLYLLATIIGPRFAAAAQTCESKSDPDSGYAGNWYLPSSFLLACLLSFVPSSTPIPLTLLLSPRIPLTFLLPPLTPHTSLKRLERERSR